MILPFTGAALVLLFACWLFYRSLKTLPPDLMRQELKDDIMDRIRTSETLKDLFKVYPMITGFYREFANPKDLQEHYWVLSDLNDLNNQFEWKRKTLV